MQQQTTTRHVLLLVLGALGLASTHAFLLPSPTPSLLHHRSSSSRSIITPSLKLLPRPSHKPQSPLCLFSSTDGGGSEIPPINTKLQGEWDALVNDGKDLLGLVDFLKAHRKEVRITKTQLPGLLDRLSDTQIFRNNILDRQEKGLMPPNERGGMQMQDFMATPGRAFMALELYQQKQLEAVTFVYDVLKEQGVLKGFGCIPEQRGYLEGYLPKNVDAEVIEKRAELPMSALTPGQAQNFWAYGGVALCLLELVICKYYGVDAGAVIPGTIAAFFVDRFIFGGRGFDGVARVLLPRYKERIIRHEAGHFLLAYLLGCPVQNCLLRPVFNGATFGEAGTIFLDRKLFEELEKSKISASSVDRYTTVVMGGIAAEALTFENAQGGGSDEQAIILLMSMMNFQMDRISTQARWAALRAVLILKDHPEAFEALVAALEAGKTVGECVQSIEDAMAATNRPFVPPEAVGAPVVPPPVQRPPQEYDALKQVLMPSSSSSSSPPPPSRPEMDFSNVTPNFGKGLDVIPRVEAKEKRQVEAADQKLKAKMREVNLRLQQVTARLEGRPEDAPALDKDGEMVGEAVVMEGFDEEGEEKQIEEQLSKLDEKLKALNAQLGGGVGARRGPR